MRLKNLVQKSDLTSHILIPTGNGLRSTHGRVKKFRLKQPKNGGKEYRTSSLVEFAWDIEVFGQYFRRYFITRREPISHWSKIHVKDNDVLRMELHPDKISIRGKDMAITSVKSLDFPVPELCTIEQTFP